MPRFVAVTRALDPALRARLEAFAEKILSALDKGRDELLNL